MTDFYYDGPIVMTAAYEPGFGLRSEVWLKWAVEESDLASSLVEALGIDEHSLFENGEAVEVHARVHVSFDPYRDKLNAEELRLQGESA